MLFKTKQLAHGIMRLYNQMTTSRQKGLRHELGFWDDWFRTKGLAWTDEYARRLDPNTYISEHLHRFINHLANDNVSILDIGAGPLTTLGKKHPTKKLHIVATDVLAREYDALLQKYNIEPPVRTIYADAERLDETLAENTFDLCIAQNCVDHMQNPFQAIMKMLYVVKAGGYVVLSHAEKEAENQNYKGLHQWNFTTVNGDFIIKGKSQFMNISKEIACLGITECHVENGWIEVFIRKLET